MINPTPEGLPIESREPGSPSQSSRNKNQPQQQSHFSQSLPKLHLWRGIRQHTNQFSSQLTNPEFIKRSRLIYHKLRPQFIKDYAGWYIAIEPDNGDYSLNADKALAQQEVRQKHPQRLICTFQLMTTSAE